MNTKLIIVGAVIVVLGGIGWFAVSKQNAPETAMVKTEEEVMVKKDIVISLNAQNASGQTGTATFTDMDGKTKVVIAIPANSTNVAQPAHIHVGVCPNPGAVKYPLGAVINGASETILDVPLASLGASLPLSINVHKSAGEVKVYTSCGNLTAAGFGSVMEKPEGAAMVKPEGAAMVKPEGAAMVAKAGSYEAYSPEKITLASAQGNVVLNFSAPWCPTCRALDRDINANLNNIPSNLTILKVDYDSATALKKKYGVTSQHTMVQVDKDGTLIKKWGGSPTLAAFVAQVQ